VSLLYDGLLISLNQFQFRKVELYWEKLGASIRSFTVCKFLFTKRSCNQWLMLVCFCDIHSICHMSLLWDNERLLAVIVWYGMMLQVLRNFDSLISTAVTEQLAESGVKVLSNTQVWIFITHRYEYSWHLLCNLFWHSYVVAITLWILVVSGQRYLVWTVCACLSQFSPD